MRQLELKIPPLVLCAVFAAAAFAFGYFVPAGNLPFTGQGVATVGLLLLAVAVTVTGVMQFRSAKTTVNPMSPSQASAIVTSGVFRFSRNPMYLGMALAVLGAAAWHSSLPGYALVALFCVYMTELQIKPEERALLAQFGSSFSAYTVKVRRWV